MFNFNIHIDNVNISFDDEGAAVVVIGGLLFIGAVAVGISKMAHRG